ncbi:hypothetical protein EDF60_2426 [Leucobacter luti]|nr:hypothetical protein EDF60_2426 [Leucobacter luti]
MLRRLTFGLDSLVAARVRVRRWSEMRGSALVHPLVALIGVVSWVRLVIGHTPSLFIQHRVLPSGSHHVG